MEYELQQTTDFLVIRLSGRLSFGDHRTFSEIVNRIALAGERHTIVDVTDLASIDSTGFGMLVVAKEVATKASGGFRIRNANDQFVSLAERVCADRVMRID
ncbi:MAG: STAS domain-containing protein [Rhodospirillaceae bacterium]